jgi:hypothetical protein
LAEVIHGWGGSRSVAPFFYRYKEIVVLDEDLLVVTTKVFIILKIRKAIGFSPREDHEFFTMVSDDETAKAELDSKDLDEDCATPVYELNFNGIGLVGVLPVVATYAKALEIADEQYIQSALIDKEGNVTIC